jgi:hypothetical protein
MSNPMKYIRDLEAAGFQRAQAEAQVQMVLDAIEGDLVTKSDLATLKEYLEKRFDHIDHKFKDVDNRFRETELRMTIKLGAICISSVSVASAILAWLIKVQ